jgi:predicted YcjX-like family ATPase
MVLTSATDRLGNAAGGAVGAVSGRFADWVIRLGVTGLSRAGKTVGFYPVEFSALLARVLAQARAGVTQLVEGTFHDQAFAPWPLSSPPGYGLLHTRSDKALQFLIGDVL